MSLVRILVDGYSLLHNWPEVAPGRARHSAAARDELVHVLTRYQDAMGTPITVFFDGSGAPPNVPKTESCGAVEVLFSGPGQTADDMIERAAHRFQPYGQIMAVTDDNAERDIVIGLGGHACSCENFIRMVAGEMADFQETLKHYNRKEQNRYRNAR
jgi:predicted RNA-binding protein with PIN domain